MKHIRVVAAVFIAAGALGASAQTASPGRRASAAAANTQATGEVLEVDHAQKRVLVQHGPIASLGMDAMTMEFLVPEAKLLQALRPGDRIRFSAVWRRGEYEITRAEVTARKPAAR